MTNGVGGGEGGGGGGITAVIGSRERARSRDRHCGDSRARHDDKATLSGDPDLDSGAPYTLGFSIRGRRGRARHNVDPPGNARWTKTLPRLFLAVRSAGSSRYEMRHIRIIDSRYYTRTVSCQLVVARQLRSHQAPPDTCSQRIILYTSWSH